MQVTSLGCYLCFLPTGYKSEVPTTSSLSLTTFLAGLIGLKENLLTRLPVYYKRVQLRNSQMEEMHKAKYGEGHRASLSSPGAPPSLHLQVFTKLKFSETLWVGFLMEALLWRHGS